MVHIVLLDVAFVFTTCTQFKKFMEKGHHTLSTLAAVSFQTHELDGQELIESLTLEHFRCYANSCFAR